MIPMTTKHLRFLFSLSILLAAFSFLHSVSAVEFTPVLSARLLGGQYFFQTQESNLAGNVGVIAAPAVAFNEQWSMIPTLSASWRGTKTVQDLVGGGTLFQQTQDHSFNLKTIYSPVPSWLFKLGGGYRIQLLKETNDERWGHGLFDYQKPSGNFETEWVLQKETSIRLGYDFYYVNFRNFSTLESQQQNLGRENASARTLDTSNHAPYLGAKWVFPFFADQQARFEAFYSYTFRDYAEQHIVLVTGDLSNILRKDVSQTAIASFLFPFAFSENFKTVMEVKGAGSILNSPQNNYDAAKTQFNPHYYAYSEYSAGPNFNFIFGQTSYIFTAGFTYVRRNYLDRPIQDINGAYGAEKIHVNEYYASFGITYPITKNFRAQVLGNFGWSRSNMKYEKTYRYNYETITYLAGVTFDY
jgi:hypothetical protein